jgi:isoquinoline 1-oxidoreductase beta subunit
VTLRHLPAHPRRDPRCRGAAGRGLSISSAGRITRRTLLVASAAVAGGLAFGYYQYRRDPDTPLTAAPGEAVFNPWVILHADGVTVITPRAEMGQGVQTTLAALVAEELDMPWNRVRAEHGPASAAYYNQAVAVQGVPFAVYGDNGVRDTTPGLFGAASKLTGLQVTGGSTSTTDAFDRMRRAGAAARATLLQAAAHRVGVGPDTLRTRAGAVVMPDGSEIAYADLAVEASRIDPSADPPEKDPADWTLLGTALPRLDMVPKVTSTATFASDVRLPGMLFATVRCIPRLGGPMLGFDAAEARALPGVRDIVDLGNGVAAVADTTWAAMRAVDMVRIDWGPAPYPAETAAIFDRIAEAFDDSTRFPLRNTGDVDDALAGAEVIRAEYRVPYLAHSTMEPMIATALFSDGKLTLWSGNQAPSLIRAAAARVAGIRAGDVTVHTLFMGGGFGRRAETDITDQAARLAVALPGTPVCLTWSREEDIRHDFYRPGMIARMSGAMGPDGPTALKADIAGPSVLRQQVRRATGMSPPGPDRLLVEGAFDQPYAIANYRVAGHPADLDIPIRAWRSVGNSHNAFFHECFIDELADARGLDPVAMRLRLIRREHPASAKVIETVAEMAGWGGDLPANRAQGIAFCHSFGSPIAEIVDVEQTPRGLRLTRVWAAQDVGIALDRRTIEVQITSGILYGLSAAVMGEITFSDGQVEQSNFHDYDALRIDQAPEIRTAILTNNPQMGGVGEPAPPPRPPRPWPTPSLR